MCLKRCALTRGSQIVLSTKSFNASGVGAFLLWLYATGEAQEMVIRNVGLTIFTVLKSKTTLLSTLLKISRVNVPALGPTRNIGPGECVCSQVVNVGSEIGVSCAVVTIEV